MRFPREISKERKGRPVRKCDNAGFWYVGTAVGASKCGKERCKTALECC